jgi:hypothetical protein
LEDTVTISASEWSQRRELELAVLLYLSVNGPAKWCALYLHFEQEKTSDIAGALCDLAVMKYIATTDDNVTAITQRGAEHLQRAKSNL